MPSYEHQQLLKGVARVDVRPDGGSALQEWLQAGQHLQLLREDIQGEELIVLGTGPYTLIHAVVVPEDALAPLDQGDLLGWSGNAFRHRSGYVLSADDVRLDQSLDDFGTETLREARQLVFARIAEGFGPNSGTSLDILQEYVHATGLHWISERRAHCRIDDAGDIEQAVSVTTGDVALASFRREPLECYLAASQSVLVRMFEFWLMDPRDFEDLGGADEVVIEDDSLFYKRRVGSRSAFTRGIQIIRPSLTLAQVSATLRGTNRDSLPVEFLAFDWRHGRIETISTDPSATTNYFVADQNDLPYETSPAFFRADALTKYKSDHEKYQIESRRIHCRAGWSLRYDVNEADQVFAYICDLQNLPYSEQLHWKSHNETPRAGISRRAFETDFEGKWSALNTPLDDVLAIVREWSEASLSWWTLRNASLLQRVSTPLTDSRDEWARSFLGLAKLVVEGFAIAALRRRLDEQSIPYARNNKSIVLLEKALRASGVLADDARLDGLRTVQEIRSKVEAHVPGTSADELALNALAEHVTYADHFRSTCQQVADELRLIEDTLS